MRAKKFCNQSGTNQLFLGIEAGGTRTIALLADHEGRAIRRLETGPANLRLQTDAQLVAHLAAIADALPQPNAIAIGMAGARTEADFLRIHRAATKAWAGVSCLATDDLETALAAAERSAEQSSTRLISSSKSTARNRGRRRGRGGKATPVMIISGTGSCCYGQNPHGKKIKVGGWGHLLGDKGIG